VKHWPIFIIFARNIKQKLDAKDYSFGRLTLIQLLHYLVKCKSRSLTVYNNESVLDSACDGSENYRYRKIIKNLLLRLHFKTVCRLR